MYSGFAGISIFKVMFDHTSFTEANQSLVLRDFMFFCAAFSALKYVDFDIFQSEAPDLTEVFWLMPFVSKTIWGDTDMRIPSSPLKFQREAKVKQGDFDEWETIVRPEIT